tara:strand:- start:860 stop:970 length:111 start_codon:yes stop_codon:yes gene_type:complete
MKNIFNKIQGFLYKNEFLIIKNKKNIKSKILGVALP